LKDNSSSEGTAITPEAEVLSYKKTTIILDVLGQYKQFQNFLADLEKSLRLIDVSKLMISTASSDDKNSNKLSDQYQYSLEINIYSLR